MGMSGSVVKQDTRIIFWIALDLYPRPIFLIRNVPQDFPSNPQSIEKKGRCAHGHESQ